MTSFGLHSGLRQGGVAFGEVFIRRAEALRFRPEGAQGARTKVRAYLRSNDKSQSNSSAWVSRICWSPEGLGLCGGERSFASANDTHLSDDKVAAKMGHPVLGWTSGFRREKTPRQT